MQPPPAAIAGYAEHILTIIDDDIAEGRVPARVRAFADLHDYLDANDYLQAAGVPEACTVRVQNEVTRRLLRDPGRPYCTFGACAYPQHDHSTSIGPDGEDLPEPVAMRCQHCGKPAHYDEKRSRYQHDDPTAEDCFLITSLPTARRARPGPSMKEQRQLLVDYLIALTMHAGFTTDHDDLVDAGPVGSIVVAQHPDAVTTWVHAAARHAAAACLQGWVDSAIDVYRDAVASGPIDLVDHHVELLAALLAHRRQLDDDQRDALAQLSTTCQELTGTAFWPIEADATPSAPPAAPGNPLVRALTGLGLRPIPPAHPSTTGAYGHHDGQRRITVALDPYGEPGVQVTCLNGDVVTWTVTFGPDTPVAVIAAVVAAGQHTDAPQPTPIGNGGPGQASPTVPPSGTAPTTSRP